MCIGTGKAVAFASAGNRVSYIIISDKPAVSGTPFMDLTATGLSKRTGGNSAINTPIESTENYIIRDQFYKGGNIFIKNCF